MKILVYAIALFSGKGRSPLTPISQLRSIALLEIGKARSLFTHFYRAKTFLPINYS
ncbi:MAG: hypothetical protein HC849_01680 [Oscillatoriales cyanobacterium RU_3_3]|nr:hypothetical protein [Microcoleus sp. SU_5_6]NJL67720.1 hypothetical protein [Microcoleus sp. SM1_3_4]NJM59195.1 hypothetical protein [Oscillatoriales cyanobacterium RU_3_3]